MLVRSVVQWPNAGVEEKATVERTAPGLITGARERIREAIGPSNVGGPVGVAAAHCKVTADPGPHLGVVDAFLLCIRRSCFRELAFGCLAFTGTPHQRKKTEPADK